MDKFLQLAKSKIDISWVRKHTEKLNELEKLTSNSDFLASTDYVLEVMKEAGFSGIERYALPCDGVTTYDDNVMPQAWDRVGRSTLKIVSPDLPESEALLADDAVEPLNAAIWSPPTPPGGVDAEVVALKNIDVDQPESYAGKIVLCHTSPTGDLAWLLAENGAAGLVSYEENCSEFSPDGVRWMNGAGYRGWYHIKGDKSLWNFSITPNRGHYLEEMLASGKRVVLHAEMNTRVYDGEIYTVTGLIPGASEKEIALLAHMYEPFVTDDANGVIFSIAVGKALKELADAGEIPALDQGIRVVFSMERYGFSEYLLNRSKNIVSAISMDGGAMLVKGMPLKTILEMRRSSVAVPYFGEMLYCNTLKNFLPHIPFRYTPGTLSDDTFGADPAYNIPTHWLSSEIYGSLHHNTHWSFSQLDWDLALDVCGITAAYCAKLATAVNAGSSEQQALLKEITSAALKEAVADFDRLSTELAERRLNDYAGRFIADFLLDYHIRRVMTLNSVVPGLAKEEEVKAAFMPVYEKVTAKLPELPVYELSAPEIRMAYMTVERNPEIHHTMSLARVPEEFRHNFKAEPEVLLLALLDGKRSLYEAWMISNFVLERKAAVPEAAGLVEYFKRLAQYGYYTIHYLPEFTKNDLIQALKKIGAAPEDKLVVHSACASLGKVEGGAKAVAECLVEYFKPGVLMMPSLNYLIYDTDEPYFDVKNTPSSVGAISEEFRKLPGVIRSFNPSHSFTVYGRHNAAYVADHHKSLTMGADSPLGKLEQADGYALMINCRQSVTFHHVVETSHACHCLGYRTEEYPVTLPDGRVVPIRTWGWRSSICPLLRNNALASVFNYMRECGTLKEMMVRHSCWLFFKLADYRKAFEETLLKNHDGCAKCKVLERETPYAVESDWDWEKMCVKPDSPAYVGEWFE